jgi:hypothetical protein
MRIRCFARRSAATLLLGALCCLPAGAQTPVRDVPKNPDNQSSAALRDLENVPRRQEARDRAAEEKREREFMERMTEFATAWNALMKVCEKGVWNAKQAQQAHKAFERLVHSEGWVEKEGRDAR